MNAQELAIAALVRDGAWGIASELEPGYFYDPILAKIVGAAFETISVRRESSLNSVVETINTSSLRDLEKSICIANLKRICASDDKWDAGLPSDLLDEYKENAVNVLKASLKDSTETETETAIENAYNAVKGGKKTQEATTAHELVVEYLKRVKAGEDTEEHKATLHLKKETMRSLFGGKIYPSPYCIGAREKYHKTQLMLNMVLEFSNQGFNTLIYNFENTKETFAYKLMALKAVVDYEPIVMGKINETEIGKIDYRFADGITKNIFIKDRSMTVDQWEKDVRKECMTRRINAVFIDFIQTFYGLGRSMSEIAVNLSRFTKVAREISKEFKIPVIYLSQVNENTDDKQTGEVFLTIGNLKGSGSVKEDARVVMMIMGKPDGEKIFKCVKNEYGRLFERKVLFDGATGRILEVSENV